jgi:hypothetical protein
MCKSHLAQSFVTEAKIDYVDLFECAGLWNWVSDSSDAYTLHSYAHFWKLYGVSQFVAQVFSQYIA